MFLTSIRSYYRKKRLKIPETVQRLKFDEPKKLFELFPINTIYNCRSKGSNFIKCSFVISDKTYTFNLIQSGSIDYVFENNDYRFLPLELLNFLFVQLPDEKQNQLVELYYDKNHRSPELERHFKNYLFRTTRCEMEKIAEPHLYFENFNLCQNYSSSYNIEFDYLNPNFELKKLKAYIDMYRNNNNIYNSSSYAIDLYQVFFKHLEETLANDYPNISFKSFDDSYTNDTCAFITRIVLLKYTSSDEYQVNSIFNPNLRIDDSYLFQSTSL